MFMTETLHNIVTWGLEDAARVSPCGVQRIVMRDLGRGKNGAVIAGAHRAEN